VGILPAVWSENCGVIISNFWKYSKPIHAKLPTINTFGKQQSFKVKNYAARYKMLGWEHYETELESKIWSVVNFLVWVSISAILYFK